MPKTVPIRSLLLAALAANLLGDLDAYVYMRFFVPMGDEILRSYLFYHLAGGFLLYSLGILGVAAYLQPVDRFLAGGKAGPPGLRVRRRTLNFPVFAALWWGALWLSGGPFFYLGLEHLGAPVSGPVRAHLAMSIVSAGMVTAFFIYFLLDLLVRRHLVHRVFKSESVFETPGALTVRLRGRMALFYFAGLLLPILIVGGGMALETLDTLSISPQTPASSPLNVIPVLCLWAAAAGLVFVVLVGRSITRPMEELCKALDRVGQGDYQVSLPVVSTDEIGRVREGFNAMAEGLREREFIRETFGKYVAGQVVDAVLSGKVRLGGESREVTVLLCDIRDFTAMSGNMSPEEVVEFLNAYFSAMVDVVLETGGTLDKFMGDAFLAVYGAPVPMDDHPARAARAALRLRDTLGRFNRERDAQGLTPIRMGISLHTGDVVAGNIGSIKRMEYTVIGDTVNLAARIEGLNARLGTEILLSEATYSRVKDSIPARELEPMAVKGKPEKLKLYALESGDGGS